MNTRITPAIKGSYEFRKHYYKEVGNLKDNGEEYDCAVFLDTLPEVKYWVRNIERRERHSFWLQTTTDKFYPDFVCLLNDGRYLVVEYKGEDLWTNDDSREKRDLGRALGKAQQRKLSFCHAQGSGHGRDKDQNTTKYLRNPKFFGEGNITLSPLNEIIKADIEEAFDALIKDTVEPWIFFNSHGVHTRKADGRSISISGVEYSGTAVLVFWNGFIDAHIKKVSRELIESTRLKAIERNISILDALTDCLTHLHAMIVKVFHKMAGIDQRLRGKGFPKSVQRTEVQPRIDTNYEIIKALVDAEIRCINQPTWERWQRMEKGEWITGRELVALWQIQDFELFDYLKKGLQAYTRHGKRIVDVDNLERRLKYSSIEEAILEIRMEENRVNGIEAGRLTPKGKAFLPSDAITLPLPGPMPIRKRDTEAEAKELLKEEEVVYPTNDTIVLDFSLPLDSAKAQTMIDEAKRYLFKMSEAETFGKSHGPPSSRRTKATIRRRRQSKRYILI